ncbi:MAG: phosphoribosylglycinamide formyltransferase [Flavobacterium sp.]|uniref:phosphoribosylglycinamide formyltransferase n=1 Tax=unclassified Flavobacterium TaxID=196869 RepID=UPI000EACEC12|nr:MULTISPECIES: phosphoribosylglycinamide formyltransferase [unclassified Flavobacterium]MBA4135541.1 phosphoribosylglycinamide formyltransferase [Flavobacterium sp.]RKS00933.1 formyltetrahydrofolate-dependent phosphoribosylglycinamide formyltransferase [Flavobacterium sp. 102]
MKKILLFASGAGSNVENIIQYFKNNDSISIVGIFTNNLHAKALDIAKYHNVFSFVFNREELNEGFVLEKINKLQPDLIVLAGFLWKMPDVIVHQYPNKIINIHPALLPKYGGKGMYGMKVHQTILENKEKETGITIHYVNEHYDEGEFIFQQNINIEDCQSPEEIAVKVQALEHEHFPKTIERLLDY